MSEYDIANTIMGPGMGGGLGQAMPGMDFDQTSVQGPPAGAGPGPSPDMAPPPPMPQTPMGAPMRYTDPLTQGPYPDVFKFMSTAEGKKITRAAIDAAIRAATQHGTDAQTKDITDTIIRTARSQS